MVNLLLFFVFFLIISKSLDLYCTRKKQQDGVPDGGILQIRLKDIIVIGLIVLIPALVIGFRSENTGVDTIQYINSFSDMYGKKYLLYRAQQSFEWLFWGVSYVFKVFFSLRASFVFFAWISLLLSGIGICKLSNKTNTFYFTLVFCFLYYQECFNIMRQMPAIALVIISFSYVYERRLFRFILTIVLASLFHSSAIFCIPLYFMYKSRYAVGAELLKRILVMVVAFFAFPIVANLLFKVSFLQRYSSYSDLIKFDSSMIWIKAIIVFLPVVFMLYEGIKNLDSERDVNEARYLMNVTFVYILILATRMYTNWIFRIGLYYQLGSVILGARLAMHKRKSKSILVTKSEFYLLIYYFVYYIYLNFYNNYATSALVNFSLDLFK